MTAFTPGWREQMFGRFAISGPAGSGKTLTSMRLARALSPDGRFAVIDTDRRAREYGLRRTDDPSVQDPFKFAFGHLIPEAADPAELPKLLKLAERDGYGAIIVDSFSHYWSGTGGALDRVDKASDKRAGWNQYRPVEADMMRALLNYPGHVFMTMRVKTEYVIEEDARGRKSSRRVGLKPDQRDSVDYEFSIMGEMDDSHTLAIVKTTCQDLVDKRFPRPGQELADILIDWLGQGEPVPTAQQVADRAIDDQTTFADLLQIRTDELARGRMDVVVIDETSEPLTLRALLDRLARRRNPNLPALAATRVNGAPVGVS